MRVSDILRGSPGSTLISGHADTIVYGVTYDSREVQPGDAFFALEGLRADGHDYLKQAISRGAVALVVSRAVAVPPDVAVIATRDTRLAMAVAATLLSGHPSRQLKLIGVTGTKGKTTTTHLVRSIFETAGDQTGLIGTVHNIVGGRTESVKHTTPESSELQGLFRRMVDRGDRVTVMEVSSHALAMDRVIGSEFDVAALTNIGHDHLDFHHTQKQYVQAKAKLFAFPSVRAAVLNADDSASSVMRQAIGSGVAVWTYGLGEDSDVRASDFTIKPDGVDLTVVTPGGTAAAHLNLPGRFNVYNALCALTIGLSTGTSLAACLHGLASVPGVPGRFERVDAGQPFAVIVDYAHTPESLANVLDTAREFTSRRLVAVFGCGGDRDRTRRPTMGRIAAERADYAFVTSDNPRSEDPERIIDEVVAGMPPAHGPNGLRWTRVVDRAAAIEQAIGQAQPGDVVVVCGKGHETYQIIGTKTLHFDDREVALAALGRRGFERRSTP